MSVQCFICGCKLWRIPLPGVSDSMTHMVIARDVLPSVVLDSAELTHPAE